MKTETTSAEAIQAACTLATIAKEDNDQSRYDELAIHSARRLLALVVGQELKRLIPGTTSTPAHIKEQIWKDLKSYPFMLDPDNAQEVKNMVGDIGRLIDFIWERCSAR
jgi:hypothetical protein